MTSDCPVQLNQMSDHEVWDMCVEGDDDETCFLAEAELCDRVLHRYAHILTSLEIDPTVKHFLNVLCTTTSNDHAARRTAAHTALPCVYEVG